MTAVVSVPAPRATVEGSSGGRQRLVLVGGGPRTVGLLERLSASVPGLAADLPVEVHVVDPHPVGGGRIWRRDQSPLLWMNSVAEDITVFTDDSVQCDGPVVPGPSLAEWAAGPGRAALISRGWVAAGETLSPRAFAPRGVQAEYLAWVWDRVVASLPGTVSVTTHAERAIAVTELAGRQVVTLASGRQLEADVLVLAQGYLDQEPEPRELEWRSVAEARGLTYVPAAHTADEDLSDLRPGEPVLVRGMGLAFVDLCVLLGEGRGGTFSEDADDPDVLTYHPSGLEPVLWAGSRRGVPYHSKLGYAVRTSGPVPPLWFTPERLAGIAGGTGELDFRSQVWPLLVLELAGAHYRRLFDAHPERTRGTWAELARLLETSDLLADDDALDTTVAAYVPAPADRFRVPWVDRPLTGLGPTDRAGVEAAVTAHVGSDLARRADPAFSSDRAVFDMLLTVYVVLAQVVTEGRLGPEDRVRRVEEEFHGFFSFLASGPPPRRLRELLALHRAGVLRFLGPDVDITLGDNGFTATSSAGGAPVVARALVEARLPRTDVTTTADPLVAGLLRRGGLDTERIVGADGDRVRGGQLLADSRCRAIAADGSVHERRFLLGPSVSGSAGASGFSRPGFNGAGLRQNDAVARHVLPLLAGDTAGSTTRTTTTDKDGQRHAS